jgi:murein L,D-transpeptidase YcbB/YkuD
MTAAVASPAGHAAIAKLLEDHGFLLGDLGWLETLPETSPDRRTSIVLLSARELLQSGPANFDGLWPKWNQGDTPGTAPDEAQTLRAALPAMAAAAGDDPLAFLAQFVPNNPVYHALWEHFAATERDLEMLHAEFVPIPPVKDAVKPGDRYPGAPILARRLLEEGYLAPVPATPDASAPDAATDPAAPVYSAKLAAAVKRFQEQHGRTADGILGPNTLAELNRNPDEQLALLRINLHRARLLPDELGARFVIVNIPSAQVAVFTGTDQPALLMRAIVGAEVKDRQTPVFRDIMERVEFGPFWNVPPSIAKNEIVPKARKNHSYLARNHYEIVSDYQGGKTHPVNADTLSQVEAGGLLIRQKPGPANALGSVKFLFPNDFSIYLHDTPDDQLFVEAERGFSHGCIRVEDPAALAEVVLGPQGWDRPRIDAALQTTTTERVAIENPLNVYIVYFTAFPNWDPADPRPVRFHPDIYARDPALLATAKENAKEEEN